jgi:F-type H+-transporting ATPase subunit delta
VTLQTGEQLLDAGRIIDGAPQLRNTLGDPAADPEQKSELVARLFGSLEPTALRLLRGMAGSRWSNPGQLLDGIEEIGIRAVARASGDEGTLESELFAVENAVSGSSDLELALGSKLGDSAPRTAIVDRLLGDGKVSDGALALVRYAVQNQRGRRLVAVISRIADVVADDASAMVVTVAAAVQPSPAQLERLRAALAARCGSTPRFNLSIDPELVGGLRVQIGDEVIDGSVANRLADLRIRLAG